MVDQNCFLTSAGEVYPNVNVISFQPEVKIRARRGGATASKPAVVRREPAGCVARPICGRFRCAPIQRFPNSNKRRRRVLTIPFITYLSETYRIFLFAMIPVLLTGCERIGDTCLLDQPVSVTISPEWSQLLPGDQALSSESLTVHIYSASGYEVKLLSTGESLSLLPGDYQLLICTTGLSAICLRNMQRYNTAEACFVDGSARSGFSSGLAADHLYVAAVDLLTVKAGSSPVCRQQIIPRVSDLNLKMTLKDDLPVATATCRLTGVAGSVGLASGKPGLVENPVTFSLQKNELRLEGGVPLFGIAPACEKKLQIDLQMHNGMVQSATVDASQLLDELTDDDGRLHPDTEIGLDLDIKPGVGFVAVITGWKIGDEEHGYIE